MYYYIKCAIVLFVVLLTIRLFNETVSWIKRKGVEEYKNATAWGGMGRHFLMSPAFRRAMKIEKLYIAREFFLKRGIIRKRSSPGTDEDDR